MPGRGITAIFANICAMALFFIATIAYADDARSLAPWLDIPTTWSRTVEDGVIAATPDGLLPGASLLLLVDPPAESKETIGEAYERALGDLAPWTPIGEPVGQMFDDGWAFRLGVGVVELDGVTYTAQTAVARRANMRVRFWALADSDDTFNRYRDAIAAAIISVQDITQPLSTAKAPAVKTHKQDTAFGKGVSGVYVGVERGLSASAGVGSGPQQVFNQSTGRFETSNTGTAPHAQTHISDYLEVDVFYSDGTYRRRLPIRGLASDMNWERRQQEILWGTWQQQGDRIIVRRGSHDASYAIGKDNTLVSQRGRLWQKISPPKNVRLEGTYARGDYRDAGAPRLALRPDGSYEDRGGFLRMIGSAWHLVVPDGDAMVSRWTDAEAQRAMGEGGGTYTFEDFTLTLRDRDGRVWQINAYVPPSDNLPQVNRLIINGYAVVRD